MFNNSVGRFVRDEINELRGKHSDQSSRPAFYHQPPVAPPAPDSYSHTASSTAGFSQNPTYPKLTNNDERNQRDRSSFLSKIESTATNLIGTVIGPDAAATATHKLNHAVTHGKTARELLYNGALVQFQSKNSARLLQVVMSSNGNLVFDGDGSLSSFNTFFMVEEGEKGRLRFHNNCNYLAFDGKRPYILTLPPGPKNNVQIEFRVHDVIGSTEYIALESCSNKNSFISVALNGHLKLSHTKEKSPETLFSVISVPIGSFPPQASASAAAPPPPPPSMPNPSAPPPAYATVDPMAGKSSTLYPQFN